MTRLLTIMLLVLFAAPLPAAPVTKALKKKPLRAKIEPRLGEAVYTVDIKDAPFDKVAEALERETGLMFITRDKPDLKITLRTERVCRAELFAQLDDILYPQGWVFLRTKLSFSSVPVKVLAPSQLPKLRSIPIDELSDRSQYEPVQVVVSVGDGGSEAATKLAGGMRDMVYDVMAIKPDKLVICGQVKGVRKLLDDLGDHVKK
ncbi:MAG: hypothetical protein ABGY75_13800 [Gemmataceae bacterium]